MSKEKQIEEMARDILDAEILCDTCGESTDSYCAEAIATLLVNTGYRLQSEVAAQIISEIHTAYKNSESCSILGAEIIALICRIKEKYDVPDTNVENIQIQTRKDCRNCNRYGKHDEACEICTVTVDRIAGISSDPSHWIPCKPVPEQPKGV